MTNITSCNSRDRVLKSLSHQEPDKVVVDMGATTSTGISAIAYHNLKKALNIDSGHTRVFDVIQQLAIVEDRLLDQFGVDVVSIGRDYDSADESWCDVSLLDNVMAQWPACFQTILKENGSRDVLAPDGCVMGTMPSSGTFFDQTSFPYVNGYPDNFNNLHQDMKKVLWGACPRGPWQHANDADFWERLRSNGTRLRESGRAVVITVGCNLVEWGMFLRRMDNFLMDIYAEPICVKRLVEALADIHMSTLNKVVQEVGDIVDVIRFGDDLGMDNNSFMSPEIYRDIFKPKHKDFCEYVKKHTKAYTCLHSCGSIYDLIPDLIDAGFDCLNPIQTNCRNMDPTTLKREFGKDVTFWGGGCDTRTVLNMATPIQVKEHVLERLEILSSGGGFVFCAIHNILPEVPPENIIAMFSAVEKFNGK